MVKLMSHILIRFQQHLKLTAFKKITATSTPPPANHQLIRHQIKTTPMSELRLKNPSYKPINGFSSVKPLTATPTTAPTSGFFMGCGSDRQYAAATSPPPQPRNTQAKSPQNRIDLNPNNKHPATIYIGLNELPIPT